MPASRATASQNNSLLITMVIFIVLFLVTTVLAVVLFMNNETLVKQTNTAVEELEEIASGRDRSALGQLVERKGGVVQKTAMQRIIADMSYMAALIGGEDMTTAPVVGIRAMIENETASLWQKLPYALSNASEADKSLGLIRITEAVIAEKDAWYNRYAQLELESDTKDEAYNQRLATLTDELEQTKERLATASRAADAAEKRYDKLLDDYRDNYENILNTRKQEIDQAQADIRRIREENRSLADDLKAAIATNKEYNKRLQQFQPAPETEMAALEPDGHIVSVSARDRVAYIDLAKNDHIYRGLTFSVYDGFTTIPKDGRGKATLKVVEIMDTIAKCRITRDDSTNPIMEKDIIASLVWSRDKKYNFCVAGEFDMDNDGVIDPDGRRHIGEMIANWGGRIADTVTVDTDFFVIGEAPIIPVRPSEEEFDNMTDIALAYKQASEEFSSFQTVRTNAAELGVPTFPLSRFLYFIGKQ